MITTFRAPFFAFSVLALVFLSSLGLRDANFRQNTGAPGLEATYHVLWTSDVLRATASHQHYLLPSVTLTPSVGNPYDWGATVETRGGSYVYTSFPPLSFWVPNILFFWRENGVGFRGLALFNTLVGLLSAVALGALARRIAVDHGNAKGDKDDRDPWSIFLIVAVTYLLLNEALTSHGAVYWAHSLSQLPLILGSYCAYIIHKRHAFGLPLMALFLCCLIYCSLEWTGFVFCLGVATAFAVCAMTTGTGSLRNRFILSCAVPLAAALLAVLGIVLHFSAAIGLADLLDALGRRATARSYDFEALLGILNSYFQSFGILFPLSIFLAVSLVQNKSTLLQEDASVVLLLFVSIFPMLENIILLQHAYEFTFDRLKLAFPMLLLCLIYVLRVSVPNAIVFLGAATIMFSNVINFQLRNMTHAPWGDTVRSNAGIVSNFLDHPFSQCALLGSTEKVRGYLNLQFENDIVENASVDTLLSELDGTRFCAVALISTTHSFTDLPEITSISLHDIDGEVVEIFER